MDSIYSCNICNKVFHLHTMYACYHGHYLCRKCYKQVYYKGNKRCPCGTCNAYIVRSGEVNKSEPIERSVTMFPNPCIYSQHLLDPKTSLISLYKPSAQNVSAPSKKPIHCPYHGCHKTIAVSSLDSHFEHDHTQVARILTRLETRNGLEFSFKDLRGLTKTLCLVLINIEDVHETFGNAEMTSLSLEETDSPHRSFCSRTSNIIPTPKPYFIVMAAKLTENDYNGLDDDEEEEENESGCSAMDKIIFLVTSNIATNFSYTIAVSTPDQRIRLKYYGPLLTINEGYKKLCDEGKGLILNHHHVNGISEFGKKEVCVDVVIHERGDYTYDSD